MTSVGGSGMALAFALVAAALCSVSAAHATTPPPQAQPPFPAPSAYPYPQYPPLRLTLRGSRPDLNYRVLYLSQDPWVDGEPPAAGSCSGDCQIIVWPGRYQINVEPPGGTGLRVARRELKLRRDTSVYVDPGSRLARGFGMGLTIGGGSILLLGLAVTAISGNFENRDTGDKVAIVSILGGAALMTAGGITLLVIGRNRFTVDPPPLRAAGSRPMMLNFRSEL